MNINVKVLDRIRGKDGSVTLVDTGLDGDFKTMVFLQDFNECCTMIDHSPNSKITQGMIDKVRSSTVYTLLRDAQSSIGVYYTIPATKNLINEVVEKIESITAM